MPMHTRTLHAVHIIIIPPICWGLRTAPVYKGCLEEAWPMEVVLHCSECMSDQDHHGMHVLLECTVRHHCNDTQLASPSISKLC